MAAAHASLVCWIAALSLAAAAPARAEGVLVLGDRELFRQGPPGRGYCERGGSGSQEECERVKTKVLSGYSYGRGHVTGGVARTGSGDVSVSGSGTAAVHAVSAALPGGAIEVGSLQASLGSAERSRARVTLIDSRALFLCRDAHSGQLALPALGMLSRACEPSAVIAIDLGLFATQWDLTRRRVVSEWSRIGPSFELLGNGHGYAQLMRSIQIGLPFDLRTVDVGARAAAQTSLGAGVRVSALYRSPAWEARLSTRHRAALLGRGSRDHEIAGELLALHNFFLSDAVVVQAGFALRASWSERPAHAFTLGSSALQRGDAFAGIHLGWSHEPPDI